MTGPMCCEIKKVAFLKGRPATLRENHNTLTQFYNTFKMKKNEENLKTVKSYAKLKGISVQAVYKKLKNNQLKTKTIDNVVFIIIE